LSLLQPTWLGINSLADVPSVPVSPFIDTPKRPVLQFIHKFFLSNETLIAGLQIEKLDYLGHYQSFLSAHMQATLSFSQYSPQKKITEFQK
jgi:hypothetical protein